MAKGYLIVLRLFVIASLPLSTVQLNHPWSTSTAKVVTVCNDKSCHNRAKIITESIDNTADPCEDFYQYVCGKWQTKHPIPPDKYEWSVEKKLDLQAMEEMSSVLKYGISMNDPKDVKDAKRLYHICSHLPALSKMEAKYLKPIVKRAGPWPMFNVEQKNKVSWLDIHNHYLQVTGDAGLYTISLHYDHKTGEIWVHLNYAVPPFGLIQRFGTWLTDENIRYQYFLLTLARLVADRSQEPDEKDLIKDIADVLAFRQKLEKNIQIEKVEFPPMTIKFFQSWYEIKTMSQKGSVKIPWLQLLRDLFKNTGFDINEDTKVSIENKLSFGTLPRILTNTPKHVIANHLHLYFIEKHILIDDNLNNALSNLLISNGKVIGKTVPRLDRSTSCIFEHPMKNTLGKLYVQHYFSKETEESALEYGQKMKDMIKTHISDSKWLNNETKGVLISKLTDVTLNMGYRKESETKDINPKEISMTPYRAISFYVPKENGIFISAGYFRSPVYEYHMPSAVNYGTISTFIAYEIYHALNAQHLHTDATSSKATCKYCWSENMQKMLQKKTKCFQKMYTDLVDAELAKIRPLPKTNGAQTLLENIADVMGIRTGMDAYKKALWESDGKCQILPLFKDLTCEKLFFISYARTYCSASPTWSLLRHMQMGTHSTARLRVNIPLANMEEFREAFQCPSSSPMVLKNSCYLW